MNLRNQIAADIEAMKQRIATATPEQYATRKDGKPLDADELAHAQEAMSAHIDKLHNQIFYLEGILKSRMPFPPGSIDTSGKLSELYFFNMNDTPYVPANLPNATYYVYCDKDKRQDTGFGLSRFTLKQDDGTVLTSFLAEHQLFGKYPHGGYALKVKRGYSGNSQTPKYAIKRGRSDNFDGDEVHALRIAMRSVYCQRLLGRSGFAFIRNDNQYLVTDWHDGKSLADMSQTDVLALPLELRMQFAMQFLRQVEIMHAHGLTHRDIKPGNVILTKTGIFLVDFDSASLVNDTNNRHLVYTESYLPPLTQVAVKVSPTAYRHFDKKCDIFAIGQTLSFLFPDITQPKYVKAQIKLDSDPARAHKIEYVQILKGPQYQQYKALGDIINLMTFFDKDKRPESVRGVLEIVGKIYKEKFQPDFDFATQFPPVEVKKEAAEAFKEIEGELCEYKRREELHIVNKREQKYLTLDQILEMEKADPGAFKRRKDRQQQLAQVFTASEVICRNLENDRELINHDEDGTYSLYIEKTLYDGKRYIEKLKMLKTLAGGKKTKKRINALCKQLENNNKQLMDMLYWESKLYVTVSSSDRFKHRQDYLKIFHRKKDKFDLHIHELIFDSPKFLLMFMQDPGLRNDLYIRYKPLPDAEVVLKAMETQVQACNLLIVKNNFCRYAIGYFEYVILPEQKRIAIIESIIRLTNDAEILKLGNESIDKLCASRVNHMFEDTIEGLLRIKESIDKKLDDAISHGTNKPYRLGYFNTSFASIKYKGKVMHVPRGIRDIYIALTNRDQNPIVAVQTIQNIVESKHDESSLEKAAATFFGRGRSSDTEEVYDLFRKGLNDFKKSDEWHLYVDFISKHNGKFDVDKDVMEQWRPQV